MRRFSSAGLLFCITLALSAGCGQSDSEADDENPVVAEDPGPPTVAIATPAPAATPDPVAETPAAPARPAATSGERVSLIKTIEQTLRQPGRQGWTVSRSSLELSLSIAVGVPEGAIVQVSHGGPPAGRRMRVQFERVHFAQELAGQARLEYDSAAGSAPPPAAACYAGLSDNGFEFSVSHDGQFIEVAGFEQFVSRCLRSVAPEQQPQMRAQFGNPSGSEAVASFVDENIGVLPADVREGDVWTRERQFAGPVPMHASLCYTLRRLTADAAEIDVQGSLAPLAAAAPAPLRDVAITLRSGHSLGSCTIDRRTGVPVYSHSQQALDMLVRTADGLEFEQSKSIVTTIRQAPGAHAGTGGNASETLRR